MLPAALLLLLFLTYPLALGTWLGFTDAKVGRPGQWVGLENYEFLWGDSVTRLALFNTLFYTVVASILKFFLGLWLAILLFPVIGSICAVWWGFRDSKNGSYVIVFERRSEERTILPLIEVASAEPAIQV